MTPIEESPAEIESQIKRGEKLILVDVREPQEYAITRIDGSVLIPMQTVPAELQRIEAMTDEGKLVIICHHGVRSLQVTHWLRQQGVENCVSLTGGIDRWSWEIDPTVPRY
jgi:adenylyltransferase/sulfurtransferase